MICYDFEFQFVLEKVGMENIVEEIKKFHVECCGEVPSRCYYQLDLKSQPINGPARVSCRINLNNFNFHSFVCLICVERNY